MTSFGTDDPTHNSAVSVTCEINLPLGGINRRIGGALARDASGRVFLVHRGKIGGGRRGIGTELFWDKFSGKKVIVQDGDRETEMALVGDMESPRLVRQIDFFVREVERIKLGRLDSFSFATALREFRIEDFTDEFQGTKRYKTNRMVTTEVDHGLIVKRLRGQLESRGFSTGNDRFRDLYVYKGKRVTSLFEVKPRVTTTHVYGAIGQLLMHSLDIKPAPRLLLVIPSSPSPNLERKLGEIGITVLTFDWINNEPVFSNSGDYRF